MSGNNRKKETIFIFNTSQLNSLLKDNCITMKSNTKKSKTVVFR